ncbi:MAG: hypothetical protein ABSH36_02620 [Solirubrobacteraceae bacterium]
MPVATNPTHAPRKRGERRPARQQTARARQAHSERPRQHSDRERQMILGLLRRGAGVTQILKTLCQPADTALDDLHRAKQLRRILEAVASHPSDVSGLHIEPRKLQRTLDYITYRIGRLEADAAWSKQATVR